MIAIRRTLTSTTMLLTPPVVDSVEMDLQFIQILQSQAIKNAMKFQTMLLTNLMMQVYLPTSQL
jgi:hypothetical protein